MSDANGDRGRRCEFKRDFEAEYLGARDLDLAGSLNPELQNFDTWLAANSDRIPITRRE